MSDAKILVAFGNDIAQVRVIGRATLQASQSLRDFGLEMIAAKVSRMLVNLGECEGMDSTFMGILAMIARRGAANSELRVEIVNADDNLKMLLDTLGLTRLFAFTHTEAAAEDWTALCNTVADDGIEQQQTILKAHEALMDADEGNVPKFKEVVEFLKQDLCQMSSRPIDPTTPLPARSSPRCKDSLS
ncbi:MAG: STAS domain-containing protein [Lentisphaeria bacterium]|jgi:anti-anti-sigma regulatory factor|nr:STAS domain-containing protein [Lentisphaeria bacterium]